MTHETFPQKVFKFCPRCGSLEFKEKSSFCFGCQSCRFTYFVNTATAVAAVIENYEKELLFVIRGKDPKKGMLDLPGGFVNPSENPEDALDREVKEELNLNILDRSYFTSFANTYEYKGFTYHTSDLFFRAVVESFDPIRISDELKGTTFISPDTIDLDRISFQSIRNAIMTYQRSKSLVMDQRIGTEAR